MCGIERLSFESRWDYFAEHAYRRLWRRRFACLIWAPIYANMGSHIMKTTIEIADDLFERAQQLARKEKTTFRSLTEQGLRMVLKEKQGRPKKLPPLVTFRGEGLTDEFKNASWEQIRDEIYKGHGA
jgi:hypothetical protein